MQVSSAVSLIYQGSHLTSSEVNSFDQSRTKPTYKHKPQCNEKDTCSPSWTSPWHCSDVTVDLTYICPAVNLRKFPLKLKHTVFCPPPTSVFLHNCGLTRRKAHRRSYWSAKFSYLFFLSLLILLAAMCKPYYHCSFDS